MDYVKIVNWKSKQELKVPRIGEDNWIKWLVSHGYDIIDQIEMGHTEINLYKTENPELYAIYCPFFFNLDTERLFVDILTESEARSFIYAIKERLELML